MYIFKKAVKLQNLIEEAEVIVRDDNTIIAIIDSGESLEKTTAIAKALSVGAEVTYITITNGGTKVPAIAIDGNNITESVFESLEDSGIAENINKFIEGKFTGDLVVDRSRFGLSGNEKEGVYKQM